MQFFSLQLKSPMMELILARSLAMIAMPSLPISIRFKSIGKYATILRIKIKSSTFALNATKAFLWGSSWRIIELRSTACQTSHMPAQFVTSVSHIQSNFEVTKSPLIREPSKLAIFKTGVPTSFRKEFCKKSYKKLAKLCFHSSKIVQLSLQFNELLDKKFQNSNFTQFWDFH